MILIIDDDRAIRVTLTLLLERNGYEVMQAEGPKAAMDVVRTASNLQLCLMDMNFSLATDGEEGLTLLQQVKVFRPEVPVILMTAWGTIDLAVRGMRLGAFDFITKPWNNRTLMERIETALSLRQPARVAKNKPSVGNSMRGHANDNVRKHAYDEVTEHTGDFVVGRLAPTLEVLDRVAPTMAPVLITGESGTGKEVIAGYIHEHSQRRGGPFVKVNLGGISSTLFESEMFGHKAGAFTDARDDRRGRFEMADGGTIFLDEIGELDMSSQVKLLRVLQDQTYEVLGDSTTRRADVRVVCATNADLAAMVAEHTFREDLMYRINLISIHLPSLRERREDIPLLVRHFISHASRVGTTGVTGCTDEALQFLQTLPLPGNIRELKNLVERTMIMSRGPLLTLADFRSSMPQSAFSADVQGAAPACFGEENTPATLEAIERNTIQQAISRHGGNLTLVARELGISRGALYRKIEKHGL